MLIEFDIYRWTVVHRLWFILLTSCLGGRVSVPLDGNENTRLTSLSQQYYYECEADTQSGKTAWIGIKPSEQNERQWVVSFNFQYQIHVYLVAA